jgi:ATP-dependent Clp protease ATP-binding subunit ClpC
MQYDAFSRNVHQVLELATALAKRYGCGYIGSEHILFGLANVKDGRSQSILRSAGYDNARYLQLFSKTVEQGVTLPGNMLTPRTKQLFDKALEISLKAHSGFVGTEHLL